ncbi:MAG TPA: hypothetical protein V6C90_14775 [Coleofasciculaceae cyanobacterium]
MTRPLSRLLKHDNTWLFSVQHLLVNGGTELTHDSSHAALTGQTWDELRFKLKLNYYQGTITR